MQSPSTGVAVIIMHENKVLIGERISNSPPCWQLPGGLIELGETPHQAVNREAFEETNLRIKNEQLIALTNNVFCATTHSISLIFTAKCENPTKLKLKEKHKCKQWYWESWDNLPHPLFLPLQIIVDCGYHPFRLPTKLKIKNKQNNCFIF